MFLLHPLRMIVRQNLSSIKIIIISMHTLDDAIIYGVLKSQWMYAPIVNFMSIHTRAYIMQWICGYTPCGSVDIRLWQLKKCYRATEHRFFNFYTCFRHVLTTKIHFSDQYAPPRPTKGIKYCYTVPGLRSSVS